MSFDLEQWAKPEQQTSNQTMQDIASGAWDRVQYYPIRRPIPEPPQTIDLGGGDLYNDRHAVGEMSHGRMGIELGEQGARHVLNDLLNGNVNKDEAVKQLRDSLSDINDGLKDVRRGVGDLDKLSDDDDARGDVRSGRQGVKEGRNNIADALEKLQNGDEDGALAALAKGVRGLSKGEQDLDSGIGAFKKDLGDLANNTPTVHIPEWPHIPGWPITAGGQRPPFIEPANPLHPDFPWSGGPDQPYRPRFPEPPNPLRPDYGILRRVGFDPLNDIANVARTVDPIVTQSENMVDPIHALPHHDDFKDPVKLGKQLLLGPLAHLI